MLEKERDWIKCLAYSIYVTLLFCSSAPANAVAPGSPILLHSRLRAGAIYISFLKKKGIFENKKNVIDEFIIAHYCAGCEAYVALDTAVECRVDVLDRLHRVGPESPDRIVQVRCLSHCATAPVFVVFQ